MSLKPEFKPTIAGYIPTDWNANKLDSISEKIMVGIASAATHAYRSKGIPMFRNQNIKAGQLDDGDVLFIAPEYEFAFRNKRLQGGDLLTARTGYPGTTAVVPNRYDQAQSFTTLITRPHQSQATSEFLCHYINSESGQRFFTQSQIGGAQKNVNVATMRLMPIPLPPPDEQRAIAGALSDVDALLGVLDRMLTKKRDLKQAAMQQLLTGQTRLPGFKGKWEEHEVQDVIERYFCGPSPTCEERNIQGDEEWGVLKTTASTKTNGWDWTKHKTLPRVFWNKPHLELTEGDLIVTKAGPRHRVGVAACVDFVPPRIIVSGKMIGLRPNRSKVVPAMLAAAISQPKAQRYLDQRTTGMAEAQVNFENVALMETTIELPLLDEQAAIAEVLSDMDAEIAALERRREKTQDLKQGMMQELLTGKTRLV